MTPEKMRERGAENSSTPFDSQDSWLVFAELCERLDRIAAALEKLEPPPFVSNP